MPIHALLRVGSILAIGLFALLAPRSARVFVILISFAIGHYILSAIYSRKQISQVLSHSFYRWAFVGLIFLAVALFQSRFSLVIYFCIHHVFNEVYLLQRAVRLTEDAGAKALRVTSLVLNFCLYLVLLRRERELAFLNVSLIWVLLGISYVVFFYLLVRLKSKLKVSQVIDISAFEVLGILLIAASFYVRISFLIFVFYHVLFWTFYPIPKMVKQGMGGLWRYIALTIVILVVCVAISPLGFLNLNAQQWYEQFRFWTYVHITLSFALSSAHPVWLTKWLQPQSRNQQGQIS